MRYVTVRLALAPEPPLAPAQPRPSAVVTEFPASATPAALHRKHLEAVKTGRDTAAFIALFNYFAPRVKAYMKKLGAGDELAEELAQDVLLIVWRRAETYDPAKSAVASWIFTIARNLRIDNLRRDQRRVFDPTDPFLAPAAPAPADLLIEATQYQQRVRAAVGALPREQAAVVSLAFFEGKSHGEIATVLAIPLGTVKSRIRLAFQRIRSEFDAGAAAPAIPFLAPRRARETALELA